MSTSVTPFFREQGSGPTVVCLHSNASSSAQWRALSDLLAARFRVIAVDGYGAGKSPPWPPFPVRLSDEAELVAGVLGQNGEPFHLVGHSYGAAVAMKLALRDPKRVRSIVIYEPTLFHLVAGNDPLRSPAEGIVRAASDAARHVSGGDDRAAAERFIDFWMGAGAWAAMPAARQVSVAASTRNVGAWSEALLAETAPRAAFAALDMPVLCMWGELSPASSLSVVGVLRQILPNVTLAPQPGLGHMGPITHPEVVNAQIAAFLQAH
jgi:pimeloyl-ACP methyl ester carboxylesterase